VIAFLDPEPEFFLQREPYRYRYDRNVTTNATMTQTMGLITISVETQSAWSLTSIIVSDFITKTRAHLAKILLWSKLAADELRRLQLQRPIRIIQLPRQSRCWRRRVCASSQRWMVWVP
jgi:hypothetical protein